MPPRVVLDQLNIVVKDMASMAAFYERLGLTLEGGPPEWAANHRDTPEPDGTSLGLDSAPFAAVWNQGWPGGTGVVIGFRVASREDVDALYGELTAAGYAGQQAPYDAFWGARYAIVEDPDGHSVGLMSPADPARRGMPPPPPA